MISRNNLLAAVILLSCTQVHAATIHDQTEKVAPVAADEIMIDDSADGNKTKKVQLGNLPISIATQAALDAKATTSQIPTAVSALANDLGFISNESDPNFTAWDKSYNDLIDTPTIPTNNNQLTNGAGYLTSESDPSVNTLGKATLTPTAGQIPKWNGSAWVASDDGGGDGGGIEDAPIDGTIYGRQNGAWSEVIATYTETDPTFTAWDKDFNDLINTPTIPTSLSDLSDDLGVVTTESDPVFSASAASDIDSTDITNWNSKQDSLGAPSVNGRVPYFNTDGSHTWQALTGGGDMYQVVYDTDEDGIIDTAEDVQPGAVVPSDITGFDTAIAANSAVAANTAKNSYPSADATKLSGIESGATGDMTGSEIKVAYEAEDDTNAYTDAEKTKLAGIENSATANSTDAILLARANHTGTQTASTISDFDTEVANNSAVTANTAKISFDSTSSTKLDGIEEGATADQTGAEIKALYEAEDDTNAFTDNEKIKLAGLSAGGEANVQADWDQVDTGHDAYIANKPTSLSDFSNDPGFISSLDSSDVKTAYESNADTNAFTDDEKLKLAGITDGATAITVDSAIIDGSTNPVTGDAVHDALAGKQDAFTGTQTVTSTGLAVVTAADAAAARTAIGAEAADATILKSTDIGTTVQGYDANTMKTDAYANQAALEDALGWSFAGGSGAVATTVPTYSDEACSPGNYAYSSSPLRKYECFASGDWNYWDVANGLVDWDNPTPTTYDLTLAVTGDGQITIDSTDYTLTGSPHTITGLNGATAITASYPGSNDTLAWSGTDSGDVTGSTPNYSITMDADKSISADFTTAASSAWLWNDFSGADETARIADKSSTARPGSLYASAALNYATYETGGASLYIPSGTHSLNYTTSVSDLDIDGTFEITLRVYIPGSVDSTRIFVTKSTSGWTDYQYIHLSTTTATGNHWRIRANGINYHIESASTISDTPGWHTLVYSATPTSMTVTLDGSEWFTGTGTRSASAGETTALIALGDEGGSQTNGIYIDKAEITVD